MPRIIVTTTSAPAEQDTSILLDERVETVHLSTDHGAAQLVERIAWAISDAEEAESSDRVAVAPEALARARNARRALRPTVALVGRPA
jgi:hypothetical protein